MFTSREVTLEKHLAKKPRAEVEICSLKAWVAHLKDGQIVVVFKSPGWQNLKKKKKKRVKNSRKESLFMLTSQSDTLKDDFFHLLFLQPSKSTKSQWYEDEKGNSIF